MASSVNPQAVFASMRTMLRRLGMDEMSSPQLKTASAFVLSKPVCPTEAAMVLLMAIVGAMAHEGPTITTVCWSMLCIMSVLLYASLVLAPGITCIAHNTVSMCSHP